MGLFCFFIQARRLGVYKESSQRCGLETLELSERSPVSKIVLNFFLLRAICSSVCFLCDLVNGDLGE